MGIRNHAGSFTIKQKNLPKSLRHSLEIVTESLYNLLQPCK